MTIFRENSSDKESAKHVTGESQRITAKRRTLKELRVGDSAEILDFLQEDETVRKIEAMGLRRGKKIVVIQKLGRGILVKTNNTRIVITSEIAKNIEVK